jgi:hypothetical protein
MDPRLSAPVPVALLEASSTPRSSSDEHALELVFGTPGADQLRFERSSGRAIDGFVINQGPWPVAAKRVR